MRPGAGGPGGESWASLWHEERGGGEVVAGRQAGGLPPRLSARPPGLWGLEEEGVQAQCCPWVRARVLGRHCLPRRQPGRPPLCFVAETRPFLPRKTHSIGVLLEQLSLSLFFFFPIPAPESFAEQVSGVKLLDWGWGAGVRWNPEQ